MSVRRLAVAVIALWCVVCGDLMLGAPAFAASAPVIEGVSFSNVTSNSATLSAQVNVGELEVTYSFQYGATNAYGSETAVAKLAASGGTATAQLSGLQPGTEYHFRIVVANGDGSEAGATDTTFSTLPAGIHGLPDGRVYEMVTPVDKEDAEVYIPDGDLQGEDEAEGYQAGGMSEAAADGEAVVYQGDPTHNGRGESSGNGLGSAYLATRSQGGGWSQQSIQPAGRRYTEYKGFSSNLTTGVIEAPTENVELGEPQLPGSKAPTGQEGEGGNHYEFFDLYGRSFSEEDYQPLFTAIPNRLPSELSGIYHDETGSSHENKGRIPAPVYAGGSADMEQLLFGVNDDALLESGGSIENELEQDVKREIANNESNDYLYDWDRERPSLVDVLPDGKVAPNAVFGAPTLTGWSLQGNPPDFSHVISTDGSKIFWSALDGEITHGPQTVKALYVRENATAPQSPLNGQDGCTVQVDACTVQIDKQVSGGGRFWTASSDGSKVFFTAPNAGNALYEYEVNPIVGQPGVLNDLTPGVEVQGVIGASNDGDYLYYVNSNNELLMLHDGDGGWAAPSLIAVLSSEDGDEVNPMEYSSPNFHANSEGHAGDWVPDVGERTAEVTSDGQGLVFMSNRRLPTQGFPSGYKNEGQDEVYVYNASAKTLFCVSCSSSGESPRSAFENEDAYGVAAAFIPVSWSDSYIPTVISEGGDRVFFETFMPLVSRDTNGKLDVYEWEREGIGSCGDGQGANGGCVYLLSGGASVQSSWLLGASANGSDVFMISKANLTSDAGDELYKVFDARVGGIEPLSPPVCTGTGCQGVPGAPPTFATPASVTYAGVGNFPPLTPVKTTVKAKAKPLTRAQKLSKALKACRRRPKKQRGSCDALARRRYEQGKAKELSGSKRGIK